MIYDDDAGRPVHQEIRADDRAAPRSEPVQLPSPETQQRIVELGQQPGWTADRVHEHFRLTGQDISLATIVHVLASVNTRERR
jgi:hypothetical protein